jgi:hypothetical protein
VKGRKVKGVKACGVSIILIFAVVLQGCCSREVPAEAAVGQRVADAFLGQIRAGQLDAAWQSTSAEFKSDEGRESFIRDVKGKAFLSEPLKFVKYEVGDVNGLTRGQCFYESVGNAKTPAAQVRIVVGQERGEWRVDGMFVD